MLKFGLIDGIIKEPLGGAHADPIAMCNIMKKVILDTIKVLSAIPVQERINSRIEKFKMVRFE